jgi:hypothetical protein
MMSRMPDEMTALIATDLGITELPIADQKTLITQFGEVALKTATLAVFGKLDDSKREEFAKLVETGDAAKLKAFLDLEVPGHEEMVKAAVAEEVKRFKDFQAENAP